jgi:fatty acid desaturase
MRLVRDFDSKRISAKMLNFFWQKWIPATAFMQHTVFWIAGFQHSKRRLKRSNYAVFLGSYMAPALTYFVLYRLNTFTFLNAAPGIILYLILVEIVNLPHHLRVLQFRGDNAIPFSLQFQVCRSCLYPRWFARNVLNNFNYHTEHHIFPRLPWYRLDAIQQQVQNAIGSDYNWCDKYQWIVENRKRDIGEVLRPKDSSDESGAA